MMATVRNGKVGTAMQSFASVLTPTEIERVVDFVRKEFIFAKNVNTYYHTVENGWPDHEKKYREVFPFATGVLAFDTPSDELTDKQRDARKIFANSCIGCHEPVLREKSSTTFDLFAISFPRNGVSPQNFDTVSTATPYNKHDRPLPSENLNEQQRRGKTLFEKNCAFCHGMDGSGKNWIGQFIEPHPRDLTNRAIAMIPHRELHNKIANGVKGTAMPAWKTVFNDEELNAVTTYVRTVLAKTD